MKIGIDLGGTNMRVGLVDDAGRMVRSAVRPCPAQESAQAVLDALAAMIAEHMGPEVEGIGVGVPTVVDAARGIVYNAANIPSWREVHLKDELEGRFGVPVAVNNDANCFALGEFRYGAGRGCENLVGVTLGTGTGGGLVLNGRLYGGRNTGAGEIGELPYRGSNFEAWCSSGFFVREHGLTGKEAAEAARRGDERALAVWREFGGHVGRLMMAVMLAYDPDVIVVGGGIAEAFPLYEDAMREAMQAFPYPESLRRIRIVPSRLKDVAILGASALV